MGTAEPRRSEAVWPAGLLGGVVGAGLAYGATRLVPPPVDKTVDDRIVALERRIASAPSGGNTTALEARVASLEAGVKQAVEDARAAREAANRPVPSTPTPSGPTPAVSPPGPDAATAAALRTLTTRLDDLVRRTDQNGSAVGEVGQKLDALDTRTAAGLAAGTKATEENTAGLRGVQTDLGTVRTAVGTLETRSGETEKRLAGVSEGLGRVSTDLAKLSPAAVQAGLRVVVAGRLDEALRSGRPLGPVLGALSKLGTEPGALAALQPYADTPAPSSTGLLAEFKPLAEALTREPPRPDETMLDKARRLFGRVVSVRAVGDGSGTDVPGIVGRIEAALARGSVGDARAAWDQLPADGKALTRAWGDKLAARAAAEDAARDIGARSLAALDTATR